MGEIAGDWISVKDKIPEPFQKVFIKRTDGTIGVALHNKGGFYQFLPKNPSTIILDNIKRNEKLNVTHWQPLIKESST